MTAKRYRLYINGKSYDYTYDSEAGVAFVRLPGGREEITKQSPNADEARADVRGLIEKALGVKAERSPERTAFLRAILGVLGDHDITEDMIAAALAKVNDAVTPESYKQLGISKSWAKRMAYANIVNDAEVIDSIDAEELADIAVFGRALHLRE
jgi:hypothetical protein